MAWPAGSNLGYEVSSLDLNDLLFTLGRKKRKNKHTENFMLKFPSKN